MPKPLLIRDDIFPYHVTSRSNNQEWFYIPIEKVWKYFIKFLQKGAEEHEVRVHSFVLMSNHYHLLLRTPQANIDKFMHYFNKNLGQAIAREANRINRIFGASYKWSLITTDQYYQNVYRYIYQNPVRAGISEKIEHYTYSSAFRGKLHPVIDPLDLNMESKLDLNWLNDTFSPLEESSIRRGLKKKIFVPGRNESSWQRQAIF